MKSLIRAQEVERRTLLSRSEIYKRMRNGTFPRQVRIGRRTVAWIEDEIDRYVEGKISAARTPVLTKQEQP